MDYGRFKKVPLTDWEIGKAIYRAFIPFQQTKPLSKSEPINQLSWFVTESKYAAIAYQVTKFLCSSGICDSRYVQIEYYYTLFLPLVERHVMSHVEWTWSIGSLNVTLLYAHQSQC